MEKYIGLKHLFVTVFLYHFATLMVIPAITDVTMAALCPGQQECPLVLYLTGFQQAITGIGTFFVTPLVGNLSDEYGRKALLTFPLTVTIFPLIILAYSRTKSFFYVYYMLKTIAAMLCEGSVQCLTLAYVADNVPQSHRASAFGVLSGVASSAFVCGTLTARFLSPSLTFQVSTSVAVLAALYMAAFLKESNAGSSPPPNPSRRLGIVSENSSPTILIFRNMPSFHDVTCLLRSSLTFSQASVVAFFGSLGESGLQASLLYYLKARFRFSKDQFADLLLISGVAGAISQLLLMPILAPAIGEERLLSVGLFASCAHTFLYGVAWSFWVPYVAAMFGVFIVFSPPCIRSIVSKQVGPNEQGKAQGCISGICSFANIISPLAITPLAALFLSDRAPFYFPGFSIVCTGFASMIALIQSSRIRSAPPISSLKVSSSNCVQVQDSHSVQILS